MTVYQEIAGQARNDIFNFKLLIINNYVFLVFNF